MRGRRGRAGVIAVALALVGSAGPVLAAPPANDDIASPIVAPGVPYSNSQSTVEATTGPTDFDCNGDAHTVWYQLTAGTTTRLEANTFGSDFDTVLTVGTPDGAGGIDVIACNDDTDSLQSRVRWDAVAGTTYLFQAGTFGGDPGGNLVFNLAVAPPLVDVEFDLTLNGRARVTRNGAARISGTYDCVGATEVVVEAAVRQRVGRIFVNAFGGDVFECSTDSTWELRLDPESDTFGGGKLQVSLFAFACGEEVCGSVEIVRTIRLRR